MIIDNLYHAIRRLFARLAPVIIIVAFAAPAVLTPSAVNAAGSLAPAADIYVDATFTPSTPGWGVTHFATIQSGVTAAPPGGTVDVAAGVYIETVVITKTLTLNGPQVGVDPRPTGINARSGGEAILRPPIFDPDNANLISITASNVTVDGFMFDGNNPALGDSGELINGIRLHVAGGVANGVPSIGFAVISGLGVQNNVFKNLNRYGVMISAPSNNGRGNHRIYRNVFDNITDGISPQGSRRAIQLERSQYTAITQNKTTRVRIGVSMTLFDRPNPGSAMAISDNDFSSFREGIWINYVGQTSSPILIDNNILRTDAGSTINVGIRLVKIIDSAEVLVSNNIIEPGAAEGIYVWNATGLNPVRVQNTQINSPTTTGVGVYNLRNGNEPSVGLTRVILDHVTVSGGFTGFQAMDEVPQTITSTIALTITNDSTVSGATLGGRVFGSDAKMILMDNDDAGFSSNAVGVDVRDGGQLSAFGNLFANNSVGVRVRFGGVLNSLTENIITGSSNSGVLITGTLTTIGPGVIWNNNLAGNPGMGASNITGHNIEMERNYWGDSAPGVVSSKAGAQVDYSPWLNTGTDSAPVDPGFQSDFSSLGVAAIIAETSPSTLQEGADQVAAGGSVTVNPGDYPGGLLLNRNVNFSFNGGVSVGGDITQYQGTLVGSPGTLTLHGDFLRPGGVYTANNGLVRLQGIAPQVFGGDPTAFHNLQLDNTFGAALRGPVSVAGTLTLSDGVLDVSAHDLTLSPTTSIGGSTPGVGSMIATQDGGRVCKQFSAAGSFFYPLGDLYGTANYSPAALTLTGGSYTNAAACIGVIDDRYPANFGVNHLTRYWTVDTPGVAAASASLTLSYADGGEDVVGSEAEMEGLGFDGSTPVYNGGTLNAANNTLAISPPDFDGIALTAGNLPPVVMFSIGVTRQSATSALMQWNVGEETNLEGYYVWRSTTPDRNAATNLSGRIAPLGSNHSYQYPDNTLAPGISYYYWLEARSNGPNDAFFGPFELIWQKLFLPIIQK